MEAVNRYFSLADRALNTNVYLSGGIITGLVAYTALVATAMPVGLARAVDSPLIKVLVLLLVLLFARGGHFAIAILLAIAYLTSFNTLNAYKTLGLIHSYAADQSQANLVTPGPVSTATWDSSKGYNKVTLRGSTYYSKDEPNLLPGGHGDMEKNKRLIANDNATLVAIINDD